MWRRAIVASPSESFEETLEKISVEPVGEDVPGLEIGEVEVEVKSCCINYPDLLQTTNGYQHKQMFPYTPGLEFAGVVMRVGPNVDPDRVQVGAKVMCMNRLGGLSSHVIVNFTQCVPMPDGLSFAEGASFRMGYETAFHCLVERAGISSSDIVLVNGGTGGMGLAAVQLAKKVFTATVIATGGSDEKLNIVKEVGGADYVINYNEDENFADRVKQFTNGKGATIVFDTVGGRVFEQGIKSTAFGARVLVVGFTSGSRPMIPANYVLIKCLTIMGCRAGEVIMRTPDGVNKIAGPRQARLFHFAKQGYLKPHIWKEFPFSTEGVQDAFRALMNRQVVGRVCVSMETNAKL